MSPASPGQLRAVPHMAPCRQRRGARGSRHPNTHVCTCQSHGCRSRHTVSALLHSGWLTDAQSQCPGGPGLPQARGRHVPLGVLAYDQAPGAGPYWCGTGPSHLGPAGGRTGGRPCRGASAVQATRQRVCTFLRPPQRKRTRGRTRGPESGHLQPCSGDATAGGKAVSSP